MPSNNMGARPDEYRRLELRVPTSPQRERLLEQAAALLTYIHDGHPVAQLLGYGGEEREHIAFEVDSERFQAVARELRQASTGGARYRWVRRGIGRRRS